MWYLKLLIIFLGATVIAHELVSQDDDNQTFFLKDSSFKIRTSISSYDGIKNTFLNVHLVENYSNTQKRARIRTIKKEEKETYEFTVDRNDRTTLTWDSDKNRCFPGTSSDFLKYAFKLDTEPRFRPIEYLFRLVEDSDHVIGPAKLLLLVAQSASKIEYIPHDTNIDIMNQATVSYKLNIKYETEDISILLYYNKLTHTRGSFWDTIPMQLHVTLTKTGQTFFISYFEYEILQDSYIQDELGNLIRTGSEKNHDLFSHPTGVGCSALLPRTTAKLFDLTLFELGSAKFSFRSRVEESVFGMEKAKIANYFVAFDGGVENLRIDLEQTHIYHNVGSRASTRILDFHANRKYLAFKNFDENTDSYKCATSYAMLPEEVSARSERSVSKMLFGAQRFAYMGRAEVRGIQTRVYEAKSMELPVWLAGGSFIYKSEDGKSHSRAYKSPINLNITNFGPGKTERYTVVIYVMNNPSNTSTDPKVLHLEIYDPSYFGMDLRKPAISASFYDFQWSLTDSPDGDRPDELFSIEEFCHQMSDEMKFLDLELMLVQEMGKKKDIEWMTNTVSRNEAVESGLQDLLEISNIMMFDLRSKLIEKDKFFLTVDVRFTEPYLNLYDIKYIGTVQMIREHNNLVRVSAQTPADCLWLVGENSFRTKFFIFHEPSSLCLVDPTIDGDDWAKTREFRLDSSSVGELYRVDLKPDDQNSMLTKWMRRRKFKTLENRVLILRDVMLDSPSIFDVSQEVKLRIRKVKLEPVNFEHDDSEMDRQIQAPSSVFAGFRLTETSGKVYSRKNDETELSVNECQAACLRDLNCRSYSVCLKSSRIQCRISKITFEDPGIREKLESAEVQASPRDSIVTVRAEGTSVELAKDSNCELYNKNYLDLFLKADPSPVNLKALDVFTVDNKRMCAELCFARSLEALKSSGNMLEQIKQVTSEKSDWSKESIEKLREQHSRVMSAFCQRFMYHDSSLDEEQAKLMKVWSEQPAEDGSKAYCLFKSTKPAEEQKSVPDNLTKVVITFENFAFDFTNLFEKKHGYRLLESNMSDEETRAVNTVQKQTTSSDQNDYKLARSLLRSGKNFQRVLLAQAENCARDCFLQLSGLWPACRSFDFVSTHLYFDGSTSPHCYLNTLSLDSSSSSSSSKSDLIDEPTSDKVSAWHYELRVGLVKEEADEAYLLELMSDSRGDGSSDHELRTSLGWLIILALIVVGIGSGLYLGLILGKKLSGATDSGNLTIPILDTLRLDNM